MRHRARPQIRTRVPACARAPAAAEPPGWMHLPHDLPACRAGTSRSPRRLADGWFGGMPASKRRKPRGPAPCPCGCGDLQRRDPRASDSVRSPWRRFAERLANPNFDKLLCYFLIETETSVRCRPVVTVRCDVMHALYSATYTSWLEPHYPTGPSRLPSRRRLRTALRVALVRGPARAVRSSQHRRGRPRTSGAGL